MNNNMNDITRVGLTANQLKNQFPDLIKFESELFENEYFANESKVGKKIFEIISGWKHFVHLGDTIYFHARCLGKNNQPYLEQEMLKAPVMISSHGLRMNMH